MGIELGARQRERFADEPYLGATPTCPACRQRSRSRGILFAVLQ